MKERVITFGDQNNLIGVLTEPNAGDGLERLPCVLMLNSGILHHVGPYRLHVIAGRHLAAQGYLVFRFDVGGIGDSVSVRGPEYDAERVVADIRTAMDTMSRIKRVDKFVLMGLCTGAANAHKVAVLDDRVAGSIFLDGYSYPTWRFVIKRYLPAVMDPVRLKNWIARLGSRFMRLNRESDADDVTLEDFGWWKLPPKKQVRKDLAKLVERNVDLLYVFSGGQIDFYNYREQFADAFPAFDFKGKLTVIFNIDADHTYRKVPQRERLVGQVADWLNQCYRS